MYSKKTAILHWWMGKLIQQSGYSVAASITMLQHQPHQNQQAVTLCYYSCLPRAHVVLHGLNLPSLQVSSTSNWLFIIVYTLSARPRMLQYSFFFVFVFVFFLRFRSLWSIPQNRKWKVAVMMIGNTSEMVEFLKTNLYFLKFVYRTV